MLFSLICIDKPNASALRAANREAHLAYARGFGAALKLGGPFLSEDGETMTGSLLVLDLPDRKAAEDFAKNDPYNKAGLFERIEIRPWKQTVGAPLG